jgi:excisionase family DNA binding protein
MDGIQLQIDPVQLEPLIRKVVCETVARLEAGRPRPAPPWGGEAGAPADALLWGPARAAKALGISERSLWTLTRRGAIPHVKLGRSVRYSPRALQDWVDGRSGRGGAGADGPRLEEPPAQ